MEAVVLELVLPLLQQQQVVQGEVLLAQELVLPLRADDLLLALIVPATAPLHQVLENRAVVQQPLAADLAAVAMAP